MNGVEGVSPPQIAALTGADVNTVRKWLAIEGVEPIRRDNHKLYYDQAAAVAAVEGHIRTSTKRNDTTPNIDPETGLTWAQKKTREEAREKQRENDIEDALASKMLMPTAKAQEVFSQVIDRIEHVPGRLASEGLGSDWVLKLRKMLDECRVEASAAIGDIK